MFFPNTLSRPPIVLQKNWLVWFAHTLGSVVSSYSIGLGGCVMNLQYYLPDISSSTVPRSFLDGEDEMNGTHLLS